MKKHPLEKLSERYLSEKKAAPATKRSYHFAYKHFINYLKQNNIVYAKTSDVINYREERKNLGDSSYWIHIQISALKGLYRYLRMNQALFNLPEFYSYDIMTAIKSERIKPRIKKPVLSLEQARQLILETKKIRKYLWHYRDHAIVCLMLLSGLKPYEIVRAKKEDLRVKDGNLELFIKNEENPSFSGYIKLSKAGIEALEDYLNMRKDDNPYLFVTNKNPSPDMHLSRTFYGDMFKRVLIDAGLDGLGITPNCLRHTAAIINLLRGDSIESTRRFMRHVSIDSTLVYQDYLERLKDDSEEKINAFILKEVPNDLYNFFLDLM